jgi:hypothetical protein
MKHTPNQRTLPKRRTRRASASQQDTRAPYPLTSRSKPIPRPHAPMPRRRIPGRPPSGAPALFPVSVAMTPLVFRTYRGCAGGSPSPPQSIAAGYPGRAEDHGSFASNTTRMAHDLSWKSRWRRGTGDGGPHIDGRTVSHGYRSSLYEMISLRKAECSVTTFAAPLWTLRS